MFPFPSAYRVPFDGSFDLPSAPTSPPKGTPDDNELEERLQKLVERIDELQQMFYAHDKHSLLMIFQAMDAAGKDGTIRAVTRGVNPAGFQVFSFKQPSAEELDHDFLWRTSRCLPERGRIGIFNRSYYEEVLVVRVHPEYLAGQNLPAEVNRDNLWGDRLESIREHEKHLARNGTVILKFWLNVSRDEQKKRFLKRLDKPDKHWKFAPGDVKERQHWEAYMQAYAEALRATSRDHAPWYAVPADHKDYMRVVVAETIVKTLESLQMDYPQPSEAELARFAECRQLLQHEGD